MPAAPVAAEPPPPDRQVSAPAISFIDSPTAACYQSQTGECFIDWQAFYVDAAPSYMTYLTVTIDGRVRALHSGFFQSAMYIPEGMHSMGFKVPCGGPTDVPRRAARPAALLAGLCPGQRRAQGQQLWRGALPAGPVLLPPPDPPPALAAAAPFALSAGLKSGFS